MSKNDAVIRRLAVGCKIHLLFSLSRLLCIPCPACLSLFLPSSSPHHCQLVSIKPSCISHSHIYDPLSPLSFLFHASNKMDTADLEVMSCPPFDPAADVRITHTVHQGRTTGSDGDQHSRGVILNHYQRGPSVGKGQHGTVFKCWDLAQNNVEVVRIFSSISRFPRPPYLPLVLLHHLLCL